MKLSWKREILPWCLFIAMVIVGAYYYPLLPNVVPSHFGLNGKPDGWMTKPIFFIAGLFPFLLVYLLLTFLPFFDPLKKKIEPRFNVILRLRDVVLVFTAVIFLITLKGAHDKILSVNVFGIAIGLLFIVMGNYMPKVPQNWFFGIRSPWSISSEMVWKKTHILGGWLFTLAGIVYIVFVSLKLRPLLGLYVLIVAAIVPYAYSFFIFKKLQKTGSQAG